MLERLSLRLRIFLFFAFLALMSVIAIGVAAYVGFQRTDAPQAQSAFVFSAALASFLVLGLTTWVWFLFDEHVARAIQRLAGGLMARAHADVIDDIETDHGRYLGELAPAAKAVTSNLAQTRTALAKSVERETEQLVKERARLASLLADVPEGVLLCSGKHKLVFYNGPAVGLLADGGSEPALDRSVFRYLREGPIQHAYTRLRAGEAAETSDLVCATTDEGRVLSARMRLLRLNEGEINAPGYVLTLRDVTSELSAHAARETLLSDLIEGVRRPAANLETLLSADDSSVEALQQEVSHLSQSVTAYGERYDADRAKWWPKGAHRAADIVDGIVAQLAHDDIMITAESARLHLRCDAYQIITLVADLAQELVRVHHASVLSLLVAEDIDGAAMLTLGWQGDTMQMGALEKWLGQTLDVGAADVTGRTVLDLHGTDIWPEPGLVGRSVLRLPLPEAWAVEDGSISHERRATYDFDLLFREVAADVLSTPLHQLPYVVFDTETTGLLPDQGDEIVQIAGVRLLNGRRVAGESFDSLVNPGRLIPKASTKVHGITDAMVAHADPIESVGHRFHRFAEDAVLVAHNAPFDMAFLKRHAPGIGAEFDHPVLDTVLLSAVLFGQSETHTLDALCTRLGVIIPPELRHTAMGDTVATAEAFLKMIDMLRAQGLSTFGEVLAEVRRHGRLLEDLN